MRAKRSWVGVALLATVAVIAVRWVGARAPSGLVRDHEDPALLYDRVWIDSQPDRYVDYVQAFLAVRAAPFGIFQRASAYDIHAEIFEHGKGDDGALRIHFPQSGRTASVRYRIRECSDLPPFDLCLDLSENPWRGPRRYYGMRDAEAEARQLGGLAASLRERLEQAAESR